MSVTFEAETKALEKALGDAARRLPQRLKMAVNRTLTFVERQKAKGISQHVNMSQTDIKKTAIQKKKATKESLTAVSKLNATRRPSLKRFGLRSLKSGGVSYKLTKGKGGTSRFKQGFMPPSLGGHAYKRVGKSRYPIVKLHGPSPWGVFVKKGLEPGVLHSAGERLRKEIEEEVRVATLRRAGLL